jgi:hypothetical protein
LGGTDHVCAYDSKLFAPTQIPASPATARKILQVSFPTLPSLGAVAVPGASNARNPCKTMAKGLE